MPDDLARVVEQAGARLEPRWWDQPDTVERGLVQLQRRLRRRRAVRAAAIGLAPLAVLAALAWAALGGPLAPTPRSIASSPGLDAASTLHFVDGSRATPLGQDCHLVATEVSSTTIHVRLDSGGARFDVTQHPERLFQVDAGEVAVLVLGTAFSVHRQDQGAEVIVTRGRVRVAWRDQAVVLEAGEDGIFPPSPSPPPPPPAPREPQRAEAQTKPPSEPVAEPRPRPRAQTSTGPIKRSPPAADWRELADQGRFDQAFDALEAARFSAAGAPMTEAMLAADVMRLSGHPGRAADLLRQTIGAHPADPLASVATFTLGRVLMHQLGRPGEAALAFARARRLAPSGALAEDALAREVEALARAGAAAEAERRARQYLERYPDGRRRRAVRRFGGLQ